MKSRLARWLVIAFVAVASAPLSPAATPRRPNILLAIGDNWAWPHAGVLGDPRVDPANDAWDAYPYFGGQAKELTANKRKAKR